DTDNNPAIVADPTWQPLGTTPNFPEYPSAHACHSTAMVTALDAFFVTDEIPFTLDSRVTGTTRHYARLSDAVTDVVAARVLVGFHFLSSDLVGARLGRKVACNTIVAIIGMDDDGQPVFADAPCDQNDQGNQNNQGNQN